MPVSAAGSYASSKVSDPFVQDFDDLSNNDLFDQFFDFGPHQDGEANEYTDSNFSGGTSLDSTDDESKQIIFQGDHIGESWANFNGSASPQPGRSHMFYSELSGRAALSDSELLSLEDISLESPQISSHQPASVPSSPTLNAAANLHRRQHMLKALSRTFKKRNGSVDERQLRSPIRKCSSPKMNREKHWTQKLELSVPRFNLGLQDNALLLTPPSSARNPNASDNSRLQQTMNGQARIGLPTTNGTPQKIIRPTPCDMALSTPTLDVQYPRTSSHQRVLSHGMPATPRYHGVSGSWSRIPATPGFDFHPPTMSPANMDSPVWWDHAATSPMAQPSPIGLHLNPQRTSKALATQHNNVAYNQNELAFDPLNMSNGLMIQMPSSNVQQSFIVGASPMMPHGYFAPRPQPHHGHHSPRQHHSYAPSGHDSSPIRSHRKNRSTSSDYESPTSPKTPAGRLHIRKRKTPSKTNKNSVTPRTPSTPGTVDFVNFTPEDSKKILTGVAPSGSSKTKARREKEALERRRKLSQAAVRAVRAAGGDVDALVEEGLFV